MKTYRPVHRVLAIASLFAAAAAPEARGAPALPQGAGHCLSFDGVDDFVGVPRSDALEPAEITVELWARIDGPQDWNSRLLRKGLDDAYFITADQDLDQRMQLLVNRGHSIIVQAKDTQPHTAYVGTWHHFTGVYAVDHAEFWVDGVMVSSLSHGFGALTHEPLTDLCIGAGLPIALQNEYFAGRIDEIRIWDRPRTHAEILATWHTSVPDDEPGLVACWHFDDGAGQTAADSSPFGNHGQLGATSAAEASDPTWVVSDAPLGPLPCTATRYCASKLNSSGAAASIDVSGSLSVAANDMHLKASGCPPGKPGIFFYGQVPTQYPFGDGYLCVHPFNPGLFRIPFAQVIDANGHVDLPLDIGALPANGAILGGSTWNFQFWFRDPALAGSGFNLSDAMNVTFCL